MNLWQIFSVYVLYVKGSPLDWKRLLKFVFLIYDPSFRDDSQKNESEWQLRSQQRQQSAHSDKLDTKSFKSYLTEHKDKLVMVDFFAPWCIWCRRLEPIWENTAKKLMGNHKGSGNPIRLASVDCTQETQLCQDYFVRAYPTIYFFMDGNPKPKEAYHGERTTTALIKRAHQVKAGAQHHADKTKERLHEEDKKKGEVVSDLGGHEGCNVKGTQCWSP